jgi:hypothetical protein
LEQRDDKPLAGATVKSFVAKYEQEAFVNHSFYGADRMTHLRIVTVALIAATVVAGVGIQCRVGGCDGVQARMITTGKSVVPPMAPLR